MRGSTMGARLNGGGVDLGLALGHHDDEKKQHGERMIHLVPVVIVLCAAALWAFHTEVNVSDLPARNSPAVVKPIPVATVLKTTKDTGGAAIVKEAAARRLLSLSHKDHNDHAVPHEKKKGLSEASSGKEGGALSRVRSAFRSRFLNKERLRGAAAGEDGEDKHNDGGSARNPARQGKKGKGGHGSELPQGEGDKAGRPAAGKLHGKPLKVSAFLTRHIRPESGRSKPRPMPKE